MVHSWQESVGYENKWAASEYEKCHKKMAIETILSNTRLNILI